MPGYPSTYGALYTDTYDPAFPASPLGAAVELYLGSWTDITNDVYQRAPISIRRGRPDESSTVQASACSLTLNNRSNNYTINNPMGAYYGLLNRNTPLRVSVPNSMFPSPHNTTYLRMEDDTSSAASCPAASRLEISGSIDVRIDASISGWGSWLLAYRWGGSWQLGTTTSGQLYFRYTPDGVNTYSVSSSIQTPLPMGRQVMRCTFDTAAQLITFYTAAPGNIDSGPWTQLGTAQAIPSAATLNPGIAGLTVGDFPGAVFDMELRNGVGGTIVARPAFNAQVAGTASWTDAPGNVWSVAGTAVLANRSYRYHGELTSTPKAADPSARDVYSQATASGVLRRLQQASTPLNSPLYRAYVRLAGALAPVAYWPCEDGANATQIASGLSGGAPMQISGTPKLSSNTAFVCSAPIPVLNGSRWVAPLGIVGSWSANVLRFLLQVPAAGDTNNAVIASMFTNGTVTQFDLVYTSGSNGGLTFNCYNGAGTLVGSNNIVFFLNPAGVLVTGCNGQLLRIDMDIQVSGSSVIAQVQAMTVGNNEAAFVTATVASASLGAVTSVSVNPGTALTQSSVGHISVQTAWDSLFDISSALNAWNGETAASRIQRLCTEEGIQARIVGHPGLSMPMGYQTIATLPALLQACETTDRGMLFEPRTCLGIGYRTPYSMYNQAAAASVSYAAAQLDAAFASTCDDLMTINDVTVTNADGSSARQVLASGPLSVQAPPSGVGRVDTSIQVSTLADGFLADIAGWVLHVSTDYHDRFPHLPFNLARPETGFAVATLDIGALLAVTNPPAWLQPDEIDQLCAGFTETLGPFAVWEIEVNGIPAYPYMIAVCAGAGGNAVRADTDGSSITSTVNATAPTLSVATVSPYPLWTTNAGEFPFDINVAGERITVTNITGAASPQTFTVTRSVNGVAKTQTAGAQVALWYTPIAGQLTGA